MVQNPNSTDTNDYKWYVPINFATASNPNFNSTKPTSWMTKNETTKRITGLPESDDWVIFNNLQTGYYKVNYDLNNWQRIANQLKKNYSKIVTLNRAQVIDDSFDLARAGELNYDTALDIISYLDAELDYSPWKSALGNLAYIENMLKRTGTFGAFKVNYNKTSITIMCFVQMLLRCDILNIEC